MRYTLNLDAGPEVEPLSLAQARDHCRIDPDNTEEDLLLESAIVAARALAEAQLNRQLITQHWIVSYDSFPSAAFNPLNLLVPFTSEIAIPLSPVQELSINYFNETDPGLQLLDPLTYELDRFAVRPRVRPVFGQTWPVTAVRFGALQLNVTAGYGDTGEDVPKAIIQWIKCAVASMYEHRDIVTERGALMMNPFLDGLLDPYRIVEI